MNNTDQRVRLLCCKLGLVCVASLAASCTDRMADNMDDGGDGSAAAVPTDVDPTGGWSVRYTYGHSCGRPPLVESTRLTVMRKADGYAVTAPGVNMVGALTCTPEGCALSGTFTWSVATASYQQDVDIELDAADRLTGSGTEVIVDGPGMCSYTFVVDGVKL